MRNMNVKIKYDVLSEVEYKLINIKITIFSGCLPFGILL